MQLWRRNEARAFITSTSLFRASLEADGQALLWCGDGIAGGAEAGNFTRDVAEPGISLARYSFIFRLRKR